MQGAGWFSGAADALLWAFHLYLRAFHLYLGVCEFLFELMPVVFLNVPLILWLFAPLLILAETDTSESRIERAFGLAVFLSWCVGWVYCIASS